MESWKPVKDFPLYRVSNYGRIKSFWSGRWTILNGTVTTNGYVHQPLKHLITKIMTVHSIVLEAFVGPRPEGMQCNHKDGNKTNNSLSNLEWVTQSENALHAIKNGLQPLCRGESHGKAKWKDGEIWLLKKMLYHGVAKSIICKMFKMGIRNVNRIAHGDRWGHIIYKPI